MKAKELIYNLKSILEDSGSPVADFTDQHLMYMLDEARAVLASRRLDKNQSVQQMTQIIDVTPTIVDPKVSNEIGTVGNTRVLKLSIPAPVRYANGEAIFNVGATDGQDSFTKITYSQLRTFQFRKYTAETPKWFWFEHALYLINSEFDSRSKVRVRGIFAEPYRVEIANGTYKYLTPFDWEYPLALNDADAVYKLAYGSDLGWTGIATQSIAEAQRKSDKDAKTQQEADTP